MNNQLIKVKIQRHFLQILFIV